MLDRATTLDKEIFTAIMLVTVMQFDILHSSANKEHLQKHNGLYTTAYLHNNAYASG